MTDGINLILSHTVCILVVFTAKRNQNMSFKIDCDSQIMFTGCMILRLVSLEYAPCRDKGDVFFILVSHPPPVSFEI